MPKRIQRRRTKGWKMPAGAVYVGRPTKWGNPFEIGYHNYGEHFRWWDAGDVVGLYAQELDVIAANLGKTREEFIAPLRGKDLVCWCKEGVHCHADILLEIANA